VHTVTDLWYTRCPVATASSIAIDLGWLDREFAPDGITVSSLRASGSDDVHQVHFDHRHPASFRQGGNVPPIWARGQGQDVRLLGATWGERFQALVALPESGISGAADLAGRRLPLQRRLHDQVDFRRATSLRAYETVLDSAGLSLGDAKLVDLPVTETYIGDLGDGRTGTLFGPRKLRRLQAAEVFALIRGEVDAIYVSGALGIELAALLDATVVADITGYGQAGQVNNITPTLLTVSGDLLRRRPDLVTRYVAVLLRAARWARTHAGETRRIIAHEVGAIEDWIPAAHGAGVHRELAPSLDPGLLAAVADQQRFLLRHGFIASEFEVARWAAPEILASAARLADAADDSDDGEDEADARWAAAGG
jgi:ABC-type nitrate/sulfonate/bicarbonate transport system substrate-binding protein